MGGFTENQRKTRVFEGLRCAGMIPADFWEAPAVGGGVPARAGTIRADRRATPACAGRVRAVDGAIPVRAGGAQGVAGEDRACAGGARQSAGGNPAVGFDCPFCLHGSEGILQKWRAGVKGCFSLFHPGRQKAATCKFIFFIYNSCWFWQGGESLLARTGRGKPKLKTHRQARRSGNYHQNCTSSGRFHPNITAIG